MTWWRRHRIAVTTWLLSVAMGVGLAAMTYFIVAMHIARDLSGQPLVIEPGDSIAVIANRLAAAGLIDEPYTLQLFVRIRGDATAIRSGEYQFKQPLSLGQFVDKLVRGQNQVGIKLTIIEGRTFKQMRATIAKAPKLLHTTATWTEAQIMAALGQPELSAEGQFFPDTYHYQKGDTDLMIYQTAYKLMQTKLRAAWAKRHDDLQLKTPYEALIMGSIIEKESQAHVEQPLIAGVFDHRLRLGMRLQTDPTVIYGLGDAYRGNITRAHLQTDTPYNTYTRYGLPPTPISLVGAQALLAAVRPQQTRALYFVARGDGRHVFSETLEQHNAAVRKYILRRTR